MDKERFERLTKRLSAGGGLSRRQALAALGGIVGGLVLGSGERQAAAGFPLRCGGFTGSLCPPNYVCRDDPFDGCDPGAGGADCSGVCVPAPSYNPCAAILCSEGSTCCPNCGGLCVAVGTSCSNILCPSTNRCGSATCGPDEFCCNESCSTCAPLGGSCTEQFCGGEACGTALCAAGEYCCNPSCSICAPIGGACTAQYCGGEETGEPCGATTCPIGEVCCNASCGICTPPDGACIQLACL